MARAVAESHAELRVSSGRMYCTALVGEDQLTSPSYTWIDDVELRAGVGYLCAPGAALRFGDGSAWVADFDEQGSDAMAELLMQGFVSRMSPEMREKLP